VGITNALTILSLPLVLVAVMERRYFSALPFLIATILITVVALSMIWPLLWVRSALSQRRHVRLGTMLHRREPGAESK
jgi:hypothetical protein